MDIKSIQFINASSLLHAGAALGKKIVVGQHPRVAKLDYSPEQRTVTITIKDGTVYLVASDALALQFYGPNEAVPIVQVEDTAHPATSTPTKPKRTAKPK